MVAVGFGEFDLGIGYIFDLIERSARNGQLGFTNWADAMTFSWLGLCDMSMPDDNRGSWDWVMAIFLVHEKEDCLV